MKNTICLGLPRPWNLSNHLTAISKWWYLPKNPLYSVVLFKILANRRSCIVQKHRLFRSLITEILSEFNLKVKSTEKEQSERPNWWKRCDKFTICIENDSKLRQMNAIISIFPLCLLQHLRASFSTDCAPTWHVLCLETKNNLLQQTSY